MSLGVVVVMCAVEVEVFLIKSTDAAKLHSDGLRINKYVMPSEAGASSGVPPITITPRSFNRCIASLLSGTLMLLKKSSPRRRQVGSHISSAASVSSAICRAVSSESASIRPSFAPAAFQNSRLVLSGGSWKPSGRMGALTKSVCRQKVANRY